MRLIRLIEVESFIKRKEKLQKKLQEDFRSLKIAREADLECCCYYHLRKFLKRDPHWKVFARRHAPLTSHYIDILIFYKTKPEIAIELKRDKKHIDNKDRKSLVASLSKLGVRKAYFISTLVGMDQVYQSIDKNDCEKYRLIEIPVIVKMTREELTRWKSKRKELRKLL